MQCPHLLSEGGDHTNVAQSALRAAQQSLNQLDQLDGLSEIVEGECCGIALMDTSHSIEHQRTIALVRQHVPVSERIDKCRIGPWLQTAVVESF